MAHHDLQQMEQSKRRQGQVKDDQLPLTQHGPERFKNVFLQAQGTDGKAAARMS